MLDTVWWRRVVYFVSLALVLIVAVFPLVAQYLRIEAVTDHLNDRAGGPVGWTLGLIKGFLPGLAEPWLTALVRNPAGAALVVVALFASLRFSGLLRKRICDRARGAWNVQTRVSRVAIDRLRPTGQRHALVDATLIFVVLAIAARALSSPPMALRAVCMQRYSVRARMGFPQVRARCWQDQPGDAGLPAKLCAGGADISRRGPSLPIRRPNPRAHVLPRVDRSPSHFRNPSRSL